MSRRLTWLLKCLRAHPEVRVFEGDVENLGRVRIVIDRTDNNAPDDPGETAPERTPEIEPIDWRWGTQ